MSLGRVLEGAQLIAQGAEAVRVTLSTRSEAWSCDVGSGRTDATPKKVYKAYLTDNDATSARPVLLKYRFPKKYRHPALSTQLTRTRITSEARSLARCARGGVRVPQVVLVDVDSGIIGIEWIDGKSVRSVLGADEEMVDNGCRGGEGHTAGGGGGKRGESKSSDTAEYGNYGNSQGGFIFIHHHPSITYPIIHHPSIHLSITVASSFHFIYYHIFLTIFFFTITIFITIFITITITFILPTIPTADC